MFIQRHRLLPFHSTLPSSHTCISFLLPLFSRLNDPNSFNYFSISFQISLPPTMVLMYYHDGHLILSMSLFPLSLQGRVVIQILFTFKTHSKMCPLYKVKQHQKAFISNHIFYSSPNPQRWPSFTLSFFLGYDFFRNTK